MHLKTTNYCSWKSNLISIIYDTSTSIWYYMILICCFLFYDYIYVIEIKYKVDIINNIYSLQFLDLIMK